MGRILVADDEPGIREFLADALELEGHEVCAADDGTAAAALLDERSFDLLVTDLDMPGMDGMQLVRKVAAEQPETQVIVLTAFGTVRTAVESMKLGVFDYLQKPLDGPDELAALAARAIERRRLLDSAARDRRAHVRGPRLTHGDPAMARVVDAIEKVAATPATVLLLGESGTGKEVAARAIHDLSDRRDQPFMALNCAAITDTLLESELFGHEKGAFTGADERRRGRVELAHGGTFFLDEVGELKSELQAKLLRVIQERKFQRVGGSRTIEVDVRWIAATNRNLRAMVDTGAFREDLYHRINVFPIQLPPLRDRPKDILPIAGTLLERIAGDLKRPPFTLSPAAQKRLLEARWPGNVRELSNVLERAAILTTGSTIDAEELWIDSGAPAAGTATTTPTGAIKTLAELERDGVDDALRAVDGNRRKAAELLGIAERTLYDKIKKYGL